MATPITHIAITEQLFLQFFSSREPAAFYIGTSFPDIRRFAKLDRNRTHVFSVTGRDIAQADDFEAGRLFHCMLDEVRQHCFKESGVYDLVPVPNQVNTIKFLEDELLYPKVRDWDNISAYFTKYLSAELSFGATERQVSDWHHYLQDYFNEPPTDKTRADFSGAIHQSDTEVASSNTAVASARSNKRIIGLINQATRQTISELERLLQD